MPNTFEAECQPSADLLYKVSALQPENPFFTLAYVEAMRAVGFTPIVLSLRQNEYLLAACTAFVRSGWLNSRLEITSLPDLPDREVFWAGLLEFCSDQRISVLEINSFASSRVEIDILDGQISRKCRYEFQLDLAGTNLWNAVNKRHKRHIKKAINAGVSMRRGTDAKACHDHALLANHSLDRLRDRGEHIDYKINVEDSLALVQNNAGEIYQAVLDGEVLCSLLILKSEKGAYLQTSAASDAGRECGAAQFLWYEAARHLQSQSVTVFNLGGADSASRGLQEFKEGFGAKRIELESAEFYVGSSIRKTIGAIINLRGSLTSLKHKAFFPLAEQADFSVSTALFSDFNVVATGLCCF